MGKHKKKGKNKDNPEEGSDNDKRNEKQSMHAISVCLVLMSANMPLLSVDRWI